MSNAQNPAGDDLTPDYMNILGMIFSMCGLMMRVSQSHTLANNTLITLTVVLAILLVGLKDKLALKVGFCIVSFVLNNTEFV